MSPLVALALFVASAALTFAAAGFFADRLDHLGPRLGLPEAVVGLLTAFAADTPELSSAVVALAHGDKQVSLGVVLGSNVFNLAAMIGLSAVLTGSVALSRRTLWIEGAISAVALLLTAGLLVAGLPAWIAVGLLVVLLVPYLAVTLRAHPDPSRGGGGHGHPLEQDAILKPIALIVPAVVLIVVGSTGMVRAALTLAKHWHVSQTITGFLLLAVLTSLPNAFTAVRLGTTGRGDALVSETFASNTINLTGGILVPALVAGLAAGSRTIDFDLLWLGGMTCLTVILLATPRGLGRAGGALLIALYCGFVAVQITAA